jgi:CRISPR/Cas system CSM-associated protein Csm2 small subunit
MKKKVQEINVFDMALAVNKNIRANEIKTTNINILLNKVRLNKKKDFNKKIIFLLLPMSAISLVTIFVLI